MSRSGYIDDECEDVLAHGRWRGRIASAIRGKRGQALLRKLADALDAMPQKQLVAGSLATAEGEFCTLGTIAAKHGIDARNVPDEDWHHEEWEAVGKALNVAPVLVQEIVFENDEQTCTDEWVNVEICGPMRRGFPDWNRHERSVRIARPAAEVRTERWAHMRAWIAKHLVEGAAPSTQGKTR